MKKILIVLLALTLSIIIIGCSNGPTSTTTTIKAQGTSGASTKSVTPSNGSFASGGLLVNGQDISSELKPTPTENTESNNNVEFEATVTVSTPKITLEAEPAVGFVFDEWELDKKELKKSTLTKAEKRELKDLLDDETEKAEKLTIDAKYAKYIKAKFDYGFYVDLSATAEGNGTKEAPFNSEAQIKAGIEGLKEDEVTLKFAKSDDTVTLDLSFLATIKGLEEVKIIGGFDASNSWSYNAGDKTLLTNLSISGKIELELEHFSIGDLTIEGKGELEFKDIVVNGTLKVPEGQTIGNIKLETSATIIGKNLTFVNSVVPFDANCTYYHSIVIGEGKLNLSSRNNITISGTENKLIGFNYNLEANTTVEGFKVKVDIETQGELKKATPLFEEFLENISEILEDLVEEDIFGFDREDDQDFVTFGPVEL